MTDTRDQRIKKIWYKRTYEKIKHLEYHMLNVSSDTR